MGMRYAGDPDWGYRLPRASLVSVLALERVEEQERQERADEAERAKTGKGRRTSFLNHPQVQCTSPEAAKFWGLS